MTPTRRIPELSARLNAARFRLTRSSSADRPSRIFSSSAVRKDATRAGSMTRAQRQFGRSREPGEALWRLHRRRPHHLSDPQPAKSSASSDPTARANPPPFASCADCCIRPPDARPWPAIDVVESPEARAPEHRLHVAEILALRRSHGGRESALLRRHVRRCRSELRGRIALGARMAGLRGPRIEPRPAPCPADGSSGWRWDARCCTARRSCFWTSRPRVSIRFRAAVLGADSRMAATA